MPSPFPGMDPYLETPSLWPDVHHELISAIRADLNRQLDPRYFAQIEDRIYVSTEDDPGRTELIPDVHVTSGTIEGRPSFPARDVGASDVAEPLVVETFLDEEIHEVFLEVIDSARRKVVAVIEVPNPRTRFRGRRGSRAFARSEIRSGSRKAIGSRSTCSGGAFLCALRKRIRPHEYFVNVSPVRLRTQGWVWPIRLSQRLPVVRIPLRSGDEDIQLDLQAVLETAYDHAGYHRVIDYSKGPVPPLSPALGEWSDRCLREKGLRGPGAAG